MQQTMSDLAGQTATDPWVMTAALFGVGSCQVATSLGLTRAPAQARLVLILAGLSTIGVAASPDAVSGPTPWHLAFAVSSIVTTLVWPLFAACREPGRSSVLGVCCGLTVTVLFAALSGWLLISTQGSGDLGLVERLTCSAQGLWPFVVALALWQAEAHSPICPSSDPRWEADTDLATQLAKSPARWPLSDTRPNLPVAEPARYCSLPSDHSRSRLDTGRTAGACSARWSLPGTGQRPF
jgi:hypothetical protein